MAQRIDIGREGTQPFTIKAEGVGSLHAILTIDEQNRWWIEDQASKNGTYIRQEDGSMRRIQMSEIKPMTFLRLGPDNAFGCSFYAKQLVDSGSFLEEHLFLEEKAKEYEADLEKLEKKIKRAQLLSAVIPAVLAFAIMGFPFFKTLILNLGVAEQDVSTYLMSARILVSGVVGGLCRTLIDGNKWKKQQKEKFELFAQCPNPQCSHTLSVSEIHDMRCSKCKK